MKTYLLIAGLLSMGIVNAQIGYKGQNVLSVDASKTNCGIMASVRYGNHITPRTVIGGEVLYHKALLLTTDADKFNVQQMLAGFVCQYPLLLGRIGIFPSAAVLGGGEVADKTTHNGNILRYEDKFIFGLSLSMPIGYIFGHKFAVYVDPRFLYLPNSSFEKYIFSIGGGVKYYF